MLFLTGTKEAFGALSRENKKLRKENTELRQKLDRIRNYKNDDEELIADTKRQRGRYEKLNKKLEVLLQHARELTE